MELKIPIRPLNRRFHLEAKEMDCLVWYVISGCKKEESYGLFVKPDLKYTAKDNKKAAALLKTEALQFFSSKDARDFISAYRDTLEGANKPKGETTAEDREKKKAFAVENVNDQIVEQMSGKFETIEQLDTAVKLGKSAGIYGNEEVVEQPRRYLPETCSACRYKLFVEQGIKNGDIVDYCPFCRALSYAKERGFVYDPTKLLDLPKEE